MLVIGGGPNEIEGPHPARLSQAGRRCCLQRCEIPYGVPVRHRVAKLTQPAIATQDLLPQFVVRHRIHPPARGLRANRAHEAFSLKPSRNSCFCSPGRVLKNLVIVERTSSGAGLAPAEVQRLSRRTITSTIGSADVGTRWAAQASEGLGRAFAFLFLLFRGIASSRVRSSSPKQ